MFASEITDCNHYLYGLIKLQKYAEFRLKILESVRIVLLIVL